MPQTAEQVFEDSVKSLPLSEQLRLAALILQDLAKPNVAVVDKSDTWSDVDLTDLTACSLKHAYEIYPEKEELA